MDERVPLTDEDRAILDLESGSIVGHTMKVIRVAAPGVTVERLRASVAERIASAPELTRRLGGDSQAPFWEPDPDFRVERHIGALDDDGGMDEEGVRRAAAELFSKKLDTKLPLWRIDVAPLEGGGSALFWRIHHVMADGTTAMRLARQVLWDESRDRAASGTRADDSRQACGRGQSSPTGTDADQERRRGRLLGLLERELARSDSVSPFDERIGGERAVAFATVPLGRLHDSAKRLAGATLNDAVLALIAGALRRWMDFQPGLEADVMRVKVPVSLHHADDRIANRDSFFLVPLPLGEPDPLRRLATIREETGERKADHDAEQLERLLRRASKASTRLSRLLSRLEASPRRFALNASNVKGPRSDVSVIGVPVEAVHSVVEIARHHALRVAVVSVADRLFFGFCADPDVVSDLDEIAAGVEHEAATLDGLASENGGI